MGWLERLFPLGSRANPDGGTDGAGISSWDPAQRVLPDPYEPFVGSLGGITLADPGVPLNTLIGKTRVEELWGSQPELRKIVGFISRAIAGVPINLYDMNGEDDRSRNRTHPIARALANPSPGVSPFRLWESIIADGLLYDRWCLIIQPTEDGGIQLVRLPAARVRFKQDTLGRVIKVEYFVGPSESLEKPGDVGWQDVPLDVAVFDHGYAPRAAGLSPLQTLQGLLEETSDANTYRRELLQGGPRVPAYVHRPVDAPKWKDQTTRNRFLEGMRDYMKGGASAGGWPMMEDGMEIKDRKVLTPQEVSDVEGRTWTAVQVSTAYFIPPEISGARPGTFSNVDAFRQMLWGGTALGPYLQALEGTLNAQLLAKLAPGAPMYIEANLEAKLRGSFLEQAQVLQSATGAPYLLRNEARKLQNRPPIPGGDELVVPLNVLIGGQASPRDSSPKKPPAAGVPAESEDEAKPEQGQEKARSFDSVKAAVALVKSARKNNAVEQYRRELESFFKRQRQSVASRIGGKATPEWWDDDRWNREMSDLLVRLHTATSERAARAALEDAGLDPDVYDVDRTIAYLTAVAQNSARSINEWMAESLDEAIMELGEDESPTEAVAKVYDAAESWKTEALATGMVTMAFGFGTHEAAKQANAATKTWITGPNARPEHAAMDGETVPVNENFSNGMAWPGDPDGDVEDLAGCNCELQFNY